MVAEGKFVKKTIFKGRLLILNQLASKNNEQSSNYECIEHPGAVVILPVFADGSIMFVNQYRPAIDKEIMELPAGLKEEGEDALDTASRELIEETGYQADKLDYITSFYTSPGYSNEKIDLYLATSLHKTTEICEEGIKTTILKADKVKELLKDNLLSDGKTLLSLYHYLLILVRR